MENKKAKYFKYAIGEVLLVVIGILIALQVNNWNQKRLDRITEREMLTNIKSAITSDLRGVIESNIKASDSTIFLCEFLIKGESEGLRLPDSLGAYYYWITRSRFFDPNLTPFKILESKGLDIIENNELKQAITKLYNNSYVRANTIFNNYINNVRDYNRPLFRKHFKVRPGVFHQPYNEEAMLADKDFMNEMGMTVRNNQFLLLLLDELSLEIEELKHKIDEELSK